MGSSRAASSQAASCLPGKRGESLRDVRLGTKAPEAGANFADQDFGLLEGWEMPALVCLTVVDQVGVGLFDPASRQARDVAREYRVRECGRV
jgi:hypothetical protein